MWYKFPFFGFILEEGGGSRNPSLYYPIAVYWDLLYGTAYDLLWNIPSVVMCIFLCQLMKLVNLFICIFKYFPSSSIFVCHFMCHSGMLKLSTMTMDLSISPFTSISYGFAYSCSNTCIQINIFKKISSLCIEPFDIMKLPSFFTNFFSLNYTISFTNMVK